MSSSVFKSPDSESSVNGEDFHFDRNGIILPYAAFVSLMVCPGFTGDYMQRVKSLYEKDKKVRLDPQPSSNVKVSKQTKKAAALTRKALAEAFEELRPDPEFEEVDSHHEDGDDNDDDDDANSEEEGSNTAPLAPGEGSPVGTPSNRKRRRPRRLSDSDNEREADQESATETPEAQVGVSYRGDLDLPTTGKAPVKKGARIAAKKS